MSILLCALIHFDVNSPYNTCMLKQHKVNDTQRSIIYAEITSLCINKLIHAAFVATRFRPKLKGWAIPEVSRLMLSINLQQRSLPMRLLPHTDYKHYFVKVWWGRQN